MIQKEEMFECTMIEGDDANSPPVMPVVNMMKPTSKMVMHGISVAQGAGLGLYGSHGIAGRHIDPRAAQLTADVAAVMGGLDLPNVEQQIRKSVEADIKSFHKQLENELHHPNNCPQHPIGCHMCYITSVN